MKVGVVLFPGTNCDHDLYHALGLNVGFEPVYLWHKDHDLKGCDAIMLPGGFSYGDYLRCGAIAKYSPVMREVAAFAEKGGPVLGICNGFQILTEAGLLPGALLRNKSLQFLCQYVTLKVETERTPFTKKAKTGGLLRIPINHGEGNYYIDGEGLQRLEGEGQVVFRYVDERGQASEAANPNGALANIAGVCNGRRNVVGLMPHPERVVEAALGGTDGKILFESLLS